MTLESPTPAAAETPTAIPTVIPAATGLVRRSRMLRDDCRREERPAANGTYRCSIYPMAHP